MITFHSQLLIFFERFVLLRIIKGAQRCVKGIVKVGTIKRTNVTVLLFVKCLGSFVWLTGVKVDFVVTIPL